MSTTITTTLPAMYPFDIPPITQSNTRDIKSNTPILIQDLGEARAVAEQLHSAANVLHITGVTPNDAHGAEVRYGAVLLGQVSPVYKPESNSTITFLYEKSVQTEKTLQQLTLKIDQLVLKTDQLILKTDQLRQDVDMMKEHMFGDVEMN